MDSGWHHDLQLGSRMNTCMDWLDRNHLQRIDHIVLLMLSDLVRVALAVQMVAQITVDSSLHNRNQRLLLLYKRLPRHWTLRRSNLSGVSYQLLSQVARAPLLLHYDEVTRVSLSAINSVYAFAR